MWWWWWWWRRPDPAVEDLLTEAGLNEVAQEKIRRIAEGKPDIVVK